MLLGVVSHRVSVRLAQKGLLVSISLAWISCSAFSLGLLLANIGGFGVHSPRSLLLLLVFDATSLSHAPSALNAMDLLFAAVCLRLFVNGF